MFRYTLLTGITVFNFKKRNFFQDTLSPEYGSVDEIQNNVLENALPHKKFVAL